ncbi:MAG TPA: dUTP pyrophosphatase [Clostridiales bacterium]|nr:dUTP pyrophosphatase [Clostridiales bacterium]
MTIKENDLLFAKVDPNAIIPTKNTENAGFDIYPCFDEDYMYFKPHETRLVPTGIASAMSEKYYIQIEERGSTAVKGIKKSAGVIDSGYRDSWFVAITNTNGKPLIIAKNGVTDSDIFGYNVMNHIRYPYEKAIAQAIVLPVPQMNVKEAAYEELTTIKSERGLGKLGSSNK